MEKFKKDNDFLITSEAEQEKNRKEIKNREARKADRIEESIEVIFPEIIGEFDKKGIKLDRWARININNWEGKENNQLHKEYVKMMETLFYLKDFFLQKIGDEEDCKKVNKFFSCNKYYFIPLSIEDFQKKTPEDKEKIVELFNQMTKKYGLEKHWEKDKLWELAEIKSAELLNKFLEGDYIAPRSSRFDDITNKFDIILIPLKKGLPVIVIDITMKQKKNIKGSENRLFKINKNEKIPIEHGISYESGKFIKKKIDASLWMYVKVNANLFLRSINNFKNEISNNNINKEIIDMICQSIISNFKKLEIKQKNIEKDIQDKKKEILEIQGVIKTKGKKRIKTKQKKLDEKLEILKESEEAKKKLKRRLKMSKPFIDLIKEKKEKHTI